MALLGLTIAITILLVVSSKSARGSQYPFRTIFIQIPLFSLAVTIPFVIIYVYLNCAGVTVSEAALYGQTHRLGLIAIPVFVEELAKLTGLFIIAKAGRVVLKFFTRLWSGVTFGLFELLLKLLSYQKLNVPQDFRVEWFTLAALTVGIHGLTCYYPNVIRTWQSIVMFVVLVLFHCTYNWVMVSFEISQQSSDSIIRQQIEFGWMPWLMLGFAYFVTMKHSRFTPSLWK